MKKYILKVIPVFMVLLLLVTPYVLADEPNATDNGPISSSMPSGTGTDTVTPITKSANKVWGTVTRVVRIVAFATIIFTGVRYIMVSSNDRANIKRSLGMLFWGAALVFGTTIIIDIVEKIAKEVL